MPEVIHDVGKLCLLIERSGIVEESCVGLLEGEDPFNAVDMAVYAEALAIKVADVLAPSYLIPGWRSKNTVGERATEGTIPGPIVGTHGTDSGTPLYLSLRACITGRTAFPTEDAHAGQTKMFLPLLNTQVIVGGEKDFNALSDGPWGDLVDFLQGNGSIWGDFFGRKAIARYRVPIHFNSYIQDANGT